MNQMMQNGIFGRMESIGKVSFELWKSWNLIRENDDVVYGRPLPLPNRSE